MQEGKLKYNQTAPERRGGASFFYSNNTTYLLGGGNRDTQFNDLWSLSYDTTSHDPTWTSIRHKGVIPYTPRTGQAACLCKDQLFIYGGQNYVEQKSFGDAFLYDIANNTWESLTNKNKPEDRNSSSVNYDPVNNRVIMFGGANEKGPLNDIYIFDLNKKAWEKKECTGDLKPLAREMHTAVIYYGDIKFPEFQQQQKQPKVETTIDLNFVSGIVDKKETIIGQGEEEKDESQNKQVEEVTKDLEKLEINKDEKQEPQEKKEKQTGYLIVMGGRYIDQFSQEILCLNLETFEWKYLGNTPIKLGAHAGEICGDKIFLFGGTDGMQFLDTLYYYDITKNKWFIYSEKTKEKLNPRIAASLCFNPGTNELMLFGGCSYHDELNELHFISLGEQALGKLFQKL